MVNKYHLSVIVTYLELFSDIYVKSLLFLKINRLNLAEKLTRDDGPTFIMLNGLKSASL